MKMNSHFNYRHNDDEFTLYKGEFTLYNDDEFTTYNDDEFTLYNDDEFKLYIMMMNSHNI